MLNLFDADGGLVNEAIVSFPEARVGVVDLDMLLGGCKLQAGLKHGHLHVLSPPGTRHLCRISARERGAIMGESQLLTAEQVVFFPILLAEDRMPLVALINQSSGNSSVKCRLFCGNRNPEIECVVPALGARVVSIATEFAEYAQLQGEKQLQAYLRLSVREGEILGAQLIERVQLGRDNEYYTSIC